MNVYILISFIQYLLLREKDTVRTYTISNMTTAKDSETEKRAFEQCKGQKCKRTEV